MEHKANIYDALRDIPEEKYNNYSPDELDGALGDLGLEALFTYALNVMLVEDGKNPQRVKEDLEFIETVDRAVPAERSAELEKWAEEHPDEIT